MVAVMRLCKVCGSIQKAGVICSVCDCRVPYPLKSEAGPRDCYYDPDLDNEVHKYPVYGPQCFCGKEIVRQPVVKRRRGIGTFGKKTKKDNDDG